MKIVIELSDKNYKSCMLTQNYPIGQRLPYGLSEAIKKGTILPKVHGRLIDADELIKQLEVLANDEWNEQVGSSKGLEDAIDIVDDTSTIIEADKKLEQPDKCKYFKDADCCYPIEDCDNCPNHIEGRKEVDG